MRHGRLLLGAIAALAVFAQADAQVVNRPQGNVPQTAVAYGANGSSPNSVTPTNGLPIQGTAGGVAVPVSGPLTDTQLRASAVPISAASLPLPSLAATSTIQSSVIGTKAAGTAAASSELVGVVYNSTPPTLTTGQQAAAQGDANANLKVNCAVGCTSSAVAQGSTTSGQSGTLTMGAVTTAAPSYTTAKTSPLSLTTAGALRTDASATTQPVSSSTLSTAALQGVQGTGSTYNPPTGGSGEIGYLSGIYAAAISTTPVDQNLKQINGTTILAGAGATGTGSPRVTVASDSPGMGATGSAVPAGAVYTAAVSSGNLTGIIQADASVSINISTATTTQLVALSSGKKIYVTNYKVVAGGTGNFQFVYGTGSNCGTGTTALEGANNLTAQTGSADGGGLGPILVVPASNALCATTSAAVQMSGHLSYTRF